MFWWLFLLCPIAYMIGGINSAKGVTKSKHIDLSKVGSGNSGATNVGRAMGLKWFILVTLLDIFKGAFIGLIGFLFCGFYTSNFVLSADCYIIMLAMGLATVIGSIFPVWYKFKGGKGIATWVGFSFFINPIIMTIALCIFLPFLILTKMMSVSTILGVIFWVVASLIFDVPRTATIIVLYCCFILIILFSHRQNIKRIFTGKEKSVEFKKEEKPKK